MDTANLPTGIRLLGISLTLIGATSVVLLAAAVAMGRDASAIHLALSALYGVTALIAGPMLLRRKSTARTAYALWCTAIGAYVFALREYLSAGSIPGIVLLLVLLVYGYIYISKHQSSERAEEDDRFQA